jgi:Predicted transcriptional regulators
MPIGKFARACRLSVKALRHYDEERLLRPAHVDERTGYRYYTREQVRDAVTIGADWASASRSSADSSPVARPSAPRFCRRRGSASSGK